jgi:hypothetical protein
MSFSPAFDRPLPRIEASLRWRTNKERLFRSTAIRETLVWRAQLGSAMQSATPNSTAAHMNAVIRVYDETGNVIQTHKHTGNLKEW